MTRTRWIAVVIVGTAVLIQAVPIDRSNPPAEVRQDAPADVQPILRRACYDCHSNETVWPWYSRVAPVSWLVASDVHEGRDHLNFSAWNQMKPEHLQHIWREMREQVDSGEMPITMYVWMHPNARLSDEDKALIRSWAQSMERRSGSAPEPDEPEHDH